MNIMRCKLTGADCESDTVTLQLPAGQRPYGLIIGQQMVCTSVQDMDLLLSANADAERIAKERDGLKSLIDDAIALISTGIANPSNVIDILTNDPMKQPAPAET